MYKLLRSFTQHKLVGLQWLRSSYSGQNSVRNPSGHSNHLKVPAAQDGHRVGIPQCMCRADGSPTAPRRVLCVAAGQLWRTAFDCLQQLRKREPIHGFFKFDNGSHISYKRSLRRLIWGARKALVHVPVHIALP